ncbi:MAG TPA: glutathione S-transferase [Rhodocyclaceae bacterium]|nr:glutathione S-transferase [Rhodocyclaceae bacterium]
MKLIGSYTSPYVRKIRVILLEKNIACEFVSDSPWEAATHVPEYNPLGKVPALVTDNDGIFFDSPIVAEYLDLFGGEPRLLPADPMSRLRVRQVEALSDGVADAGSMIFKERQRAAAQQSPEWMERQRGKIELGLNALEAHAKDGTWLASNAISIADIAVGCLLGWLDFRFAETNWRAQRPALAAHADRLFARPSFQKTTPPG